MTLIPRSLTKPTPRPSAVHRVPNGRDALGARVMRGRGLDPSKLAAHSTNAPAGFCRQYASRPVAESSGVFRTVAPPGLAAVSPGATLPSTSAMDAPAMTIPAARYGRSARAWRMSSIIRLMPDPLAAAKTFMSALETKDAEKAASVCADDVAIELPGGENQIEGKDGARQLIRMAPSFVRIVREEQVEGNVVILKGLTRSPGHFANYTTWTFETDGNLIKHVTFAWRPAN